MNGCGRRVTLPPGGSSFSQTIVRRCCFRAIAKQSHCCHDCVMPVEMTSAATWLGSAHLRLGACVGPPRAAESPVHHPVRMCSARLWTSPWISFVGEQGVRARPRMRARCDDAIAEARNNAPVARANLLIDGAYDAFSVRLQGLQPALALLCRHMDGTPAFRSCRRKPSSETAYIGRPCPLASFPKKAE